MEKQNTPRSNALFYLRHSRGLALKQVAKMLGQGSSGQMSAYERGTTKPSLLVAIKLMLIYNSDLKDMFPELAELSRIEIEIEKTIKQRSLIFRYPDRIKLLQSINSCSFEDKVESDMSDDDRELVRSHLRELSKKVARI